MKKAALRKLLDRLYTEHAEAANHALRLRKLEPKSEIDIGMQQERIMRAMHSSQWAGELIDNVLDLFCDED